MFYWLFKNRPRDFFRCTINQLDSSSYESIVGIEDCFYL